MSLTQKGDVLFTHTPDGGEMSVIDGITEMTVAMESAAQLCLTGGNKDDYNTADTEKNQWMGNEDEEPQYRFRSRFNSLLYSGRPITSQLIRDMGEAAALDILDGFAGYLNTVTSQVTVTAKNHFTVESTIETVEGKFIDIQNEIFRQ